MKLVEIMRVDMVICPTLESKWDFVEFEGLELVFVAGNNRRRRLSNRLPRHLRCRGFLSGHAGVVAVAETSQLLVELSLADRQSCCGANGQLPPYNILMLPPSTEILDRLEKKDMTRITIYTF